MAKSSTKEQPAKSCPSLDHAAMESPHCPWVIGRAYLIRTVTYFALGRLVHLGDKELMLEEASWVADTGRFHEALKSGKLVEVEPFPASLIVGRGAIVDACEWQHALPNIAI